MTLPWGRERGGDDGPGRAQQIDQDLGRVKPALLSRAHNAREDLLGVGAAVRPVAATDFAVDHGGPEGLFGAPVGRVDGGVEEKAEQGRQFDTQMRGKPLHGGERPDVVERREDLGDQVPPRHGDAMVGDGPGGAPVAEAQRLLQGRVDSRGKRGARMIVDQVVRPSQEVRDARLMARGSEVAR